MKVKVGILTICLILTCLGSIGFGFTEEINGLLVISDVNNLLTWEPIYHSKFVKFVIFKKEATKKFTPKPPIWEGRTTLVNLYQLGDFKPNVVYEITVRAVYQMPMLLNTDTKIHVIVHY